MKTRLKKRYGQHFLRDTGIIRRIVDLIRPGPGDLMVEVGAGDGAISIRLAPKVLRLFAIEIDRDVLPSLSLALKPCSNTEIVGQDVLSLDLPALVSPYLAPGVELRFAGNLPYNIGTAIIENLMALPLPIRDMTFMLQLETAERVVAAPGSKQYGFFSVFCQHNCDIRLAFKVSPACFVPRPRVNSAMIVLRPRGGLRDPRFENDFLTVTKAAFAYRRKTLANSLQRHAGLGPVAAELLAAAGISGSRRAEDLGVAEYERLTRAYHEYQTLDLRL